MLRSICICERGQVRAVNQDCAGVFTLGDQGLYVVADGMGGHYAGEKASQTVLLALEKWWKRFLAASVFPGFLQGVEQLKEVLKECHEEIIAFTPPGKICGTTLVLLWIRKKNYALFSVGDSRCYQVQKKGIRHSGLIQLTCDDTVGEGGMGGKQNEGKLLRALGAGNCMFSLHTGSIDSHTLFALCSDGIYKYCSDRVWKREIKKAARGDNLEKSAQMIIREVESNGAKDNYSLVLVSIP